MKPFIPAIAALALVAAPLPAEDKPSKTPISAKEINTRYEVIGQLGLPLGTVCEVEATIINGDDLRTKAQAGRYLLRIETVRGISLEEKPIMEFSGAPGSSPPPASAFELYEEKHGEKAKSLTSVQIAELNKGYVGSRRKLMVYETGGFRGSPKLPSGYGGWADVAFAFRTEVAVLEDVSRVEKPKAK